VIVNPHMTTRTVTVSQLATGIICAMQFGRWWHVTRNFEVSVVGHNRLNNHHLEFVDFAGGLASTQVRRGGYAMVSWTY
jgi:hypothetical protein